MSTVLKIIAALGVLACVVAVFAVIVEVTLLLLMHNENTTK